MGASFPNKKTTVEECKSISTTFLKKHGYLYGSWKGGMKWMRNGEEISSIEFMITTMKQDGHIRLQYAHTDRQTGKKEGLDYTAQLVTTPCYFGGRRWWLLCPLVKNGVSCSRRVLKLHLGGKYFGCRHCYNLTYTSSQEHDSRVNWLIGHPKLLAGMLNKGGCPSIISLRAAMKSKKWL